MPFQIIRDKIPQLPAGSDKESVRDWYKSAFVKAAEEGAESLRVPLAAPFSVALSETETFLTDHDMTVYLVVPDGQSAPLQDRYNDIDDYISENYVEEVKEKENHFFGSVICEQAISRPVGAFKASLKKKSTAARAETFMPDEVMEECSISFEEARSLDDVVNNLDKTFMELVFSFADEKGMTDVEVQKRANLDRKAFSKLKCGTTKNPSKGTALALAVALKLGLDDTKDLLSRAGFALSPCSKQDVIVQYFIEHGAYDIYEINMALFEHGEQILGSQAV